MARNPAIRHYDSDVRKGAVESEAPADANESSLRGQLGHRDPNSMIKDSDSDFPEPGSSPEHTGQRE